MRGTAPVYITTVLDTGYPTQGTDLEDERMKVVGYVRVSTEEQAASGLSIEAQRIKIAQYAEMYELDLTTILVDAGYSAKTLNRPNMTVVLSLLSQGDVDGVVIHKLDRLTRSVSDMGTLLDDYFVAGRLRPKKLGPASLHSVTDKIDTTSPGGRLILHILASVAQWEREAIAERTKTALAQKKAQGVILGAPRMSDDETIERIVTLAGDGMSYRDICDVLTGEGRLTVRGGLWHPGTVRKILLRSPLAEAV